MERVVIMVAVAAAIACGDPDPVVGPQNIVATRENTLAASLEVMSTGTPPPFTAVVAVGGNRLLLGNDHAELVYFDGAAPRTLTQDFVVAEAATLMDGRVMLREARGTLHVFADGKLQASPLDDALGGHTRAFEAVGGALYGLADGALFIWREGALTAFEGVATGATRLAVERSGDVLVIDASALRRIDVAEARNIAILTETNIADVAIDAAGDLFVARGKVVELRLADEVQTTFTFDTNVRRLLTHRLLEGVWVQTEGRELWWLRGTETPRFAASAVVSAELDSLGRLVVSDGQKVSRITRLASNNGIVLDEGLLSAPIASPTAIELTVADLPGVLDVTAEADGHPLLVRDRPWRVLLSPWVLGDTGLIEVSVRSSGAIESRSLTLRATTAAVPSWSDTVSEIASASCTACHHSGSGAKALDVRATWEESIDDILTRVTAGSMPPRPQAPLADQDVLRLQGWALGGHVP